MNGPESFTPDGNFILGEAPELRNFFVGAGFNSIGIASAGGAGRALAEWIVAGEPTLDLWPVDIRRFARFHGNDALLRRARRRDARPALHDAVAEPRAGDGAAVPPLAALRPARGASGACSAPRWAGSGRTASPATRARRAASAIRWGRAELVRHASRPSTAPTREARRRSSTRPRSANSWCRAATPRRVLQRLCANDVAVPVGRIGLHRPAQRARHLRERPHRSRGSRRTAS